ncbi:MAG: PEGA domain-containing protein [bacterium]
MSLFRIPHAAGRIRARHAVILLLLAAGVHARDAEAPPVGSLRVTSEPAKATVLIDRQVRGVTPLALPGLPAGAHLVAVQKPGFVEACQTVELLGQDAREVEFKLEAVTGLLLLQSSPSNADVTVNGVAMGSTPVLVTTLPVGTHRLRVAAPGFQPKEVEVKLEDRTPVRKQVELISNSATLTVETEAEGASIRINGIDRGGSPCTTDRIPEGDVTVELRADGYQPLTHRMKLAAGETQKVRLPMVPIPAALRIVSIPDKARVYINNEPRGQTPLDLPDLAPGRYRVRVEMEGHDPNARDVELDRGARKSEEFRLASNTGRIELITEPDRVTVFLDGKKFGETRAKPEATTNISEPLPIEPVAAGEHELRLVRKGYADGRQKVVIELGKTLPLTVKLARRFVPDCMVATLRGASYRGMLVSDTDEAIRLETAPGVMTTIPRKDVLYQRVIREDGTLE